jgi:hypothetical protein
MTNQKLEQLEFPEILIWENKIKNDFLDKCVNEAEEMFAKYIICGISFIGIIAGGAYVIQKATEIWPSFAKGINYFTN